jgi:hypothetical protein
MRSDERTSFGTTNSKSVIAISTVRPESGAAGSVVSELQPTPNTANMMHAEIYFALITIAKYHA